MEKLLNQSINKLSNDWNKLNWDFKDYKIGSKMDKISQWQGDSNEDIIVVVFKGKEISEPFHRQDFFFIDYAYHNSYDALSSDFDNLITINEDDCYIGQPFSGYALRGYNKDDEIIMIGIHIKRETFFKEYFPALATNNKMFHFFLEPQKDEFSEEFIHLNLKDNPNIRKLLEIMVIEYANKTNDTQNILKPLLLSLFLQISRNYNLERNEDTASLKDKIVDYIKSHSNSVTLDEVSSVFAYHPNYISSMLRKEYGMSFSEIILKDRMEKAKLLLKSSDFTNEQIAEMLGYSNTSNYYKAFKKYYGTTPRKNDSL